MITLLRRFNWLIWIFLIFGGSVATMSMIAMDRDKFAWIIGISTGCLCLAWYLYIDWLLGLRRHVTGYMGMMVEDLTFVDKSLSSRKLVDVVRSLQILRERSPLTLYAVKTSYDLKGLRDGNTKLESLAWRTVDVEGGTLLNIPENGVYFLDVQEMKAVVKATFEPNATSCDGMSVAGATIQVIAKSIEAGNAIVKWLLNESSTHSILRGQMVHVHQASNPYEECSLEIVKRPVAQRARIVLPQEVLSLSERLVSGRSKHFDKLASLGYSSRLGLLFYGPPGTGKTLVIKHLLSQLPDHTVVVPVDLAPQTLRECFRLAAYLEPTVIIIEDVDLLATNRKAQSTNLDSLQELMNQLDGLSSTSNTMIILSTNQPEVLEPALASRPGRISQAIEFPLPDCEARLQLLKLFFGEGSGEKIHLHEVDLNAWAKKTEKASPAFLQELCKRTILLSCDRASEIITVREDDIREAMHQLIVTGGQLNRSVLGFPEATED